jgi:hypothetical protein
VSHVQLHLDSHVRSVKGRDIYTLVASTAETSGNDSHSGKTEQRK